MTKAQAIKILEEIKMFDDSIYQYNPAYLEALDIAIQAIGIGEDLDKITKEILFTSKYYRENVNTDKADGMIIALQIMNKYRGVKND